MNTIEAWQKQKQIVENYKKNNPEAIVREKNQPENEVLDEIGIWNISPYRTKGYFRLHPEDFIVEEMTRENEIIKVNDLKYYKDKNKEGKEITTLYAHLIKIGIPTAVALERLAKALEIDINKIGYAGLKDADALTAQRIAFSKNDLDPEDILKKDIDNIILNNFYYSNGSINPGDLAKNNFTITMRTELELEGRTLDIKLNTISKHGILNYFQNQRFGGVRLISHKLGKLLLQGNYELAIKYYLFKNNKYDFPLNIKIRKQAEKEYPNWKKIHELFNELPYSFFNENRLLSFMENDPKNFIGGLIEIKDQTLFWTYAYSSWLFNKHLSEYASQNGCTDEEFPIFNDDQAASAKIYQKYLTEDEIINVKKTLYPFKFIQFKDRFIKGRIQVNDINFKIIKGGAVLNFSLPKGCYATTFLMNLFELHQGQPIPDWVDTTIIDPKEVLGRGSLKEVKERLNKYWYSKLED